MKNVNYSEEVTATIVAAYAANPNMETVKDLAVTFERQRSQSSESCLEKEYIRKRAILRRLVLNP